MKDKYAGKGYCSYCEQEVEVYWVDNGIGAYEYWGALGVHHDWQPECSQCGAIVDDFEEVGDIWHDNY